MSTKFILIITLLNLIQSLFFTKSKTNLFIWLVTGIIIGIITTSILYLFSNEWNNLYLLLIVNISLLFGTFQRWHNYIEFKVVFNKHALPEIYFTSKDEINYKDLLLFISNSAKRVISHLSPTYRSKLSYKLADFIDIADKSGIYVASDLMLGSRMIAEISLKSSMVNEKDIFVHKWSGIKLSKASLIAKYSYRSLEINLIQAFFYLLKEVAKSIDDANRESLLNILRAKSEEWQKYQL